MTHTLPQLHAGIHTMQVETAGVVMETLPPGIREIRQRIDRETGEIKSTLVVNPNTLACGDDNYLNTYREVKHVITDICRTYSLPRLVITRIDFRIDAYEGRYGDLLKLNRAVIALLSKHLKMDAWSSQHLTRLYDKTLRMQNAYYEAEYYDRHDKTKKEGLTTARLELRHKGRKWKISDTPLLVKQWCEYITELPEYYTGLQDEYNRTLLDLWNNEEHNNMFQFIKQYQAYIFTHTQLEKLLKLIGSKSPRNTARTYAQHMNLEKVSNIKFRRYTKLLIKTLRDFIK